MEPDVVSTRDKIRQAIGDGDAKAAARLRKQMTEEFLDSGKFADATIAFECLAEANADKLGWKHKETKQAYAELIGFAFLIGCQNDESDYTYLEKALDVAESRFGSGSPLAMAARGYVAHGMLRDDNPDKGVALAEQNVKESRSLGDDSPLGAYYRLELAVAQASAELPNHGRNEHARHDLQISDHASHIDRESRHLGELVGTEHPLALYGRFHLASLQSTAGNHVKAVRTLEPFESALEDYRDDNAFALSTQIAELRSSGAVFGWKPDTLKALRKAVAMLSGVRGDQDDRTLAARAALGAAYFHADDLYGALEVLNSTERDVKDAWGPVHPSTLAVRDLVVICLHHMGRRGQATEANEKIIADCERIEGSDSQAAQVRRRRRRPLNEGYKRPKKRRFGTYPDPNGE